MVDDVSECGIASSGGVGNSGSGGGRPDCRSDGQVRIVEDQGARDSGGDGGGVDQPQPDRAEGGDPEADFGGDRDWHGRAVWRGGADHSDGRSDRIAGGADVAYYGGRAESAAGVWGGGGNVGDV